jgi:hypothetical protein
VVITATALLIRMVWYSKIKGLTEKVIELYPTMSSREIADITGFAKTTIIRCAAKNHLRHTEETQKRIDEYVRQRRSSGRKSYDYSKLSKKITHTRKMESWRVRSGLEQNTKYKFVSLQSAYKMQCIILDKSMVISMKLLTKLNYITIRKQDV